MYKGFKYNLDNLNEVMNILLSENGCPWDKEQTHQSLVKYMIEECNEVIEAINNGDMENLCEELGDVLFQVVFHSKLAEKENLFSVSDVIDGVTRKMINRHTHVFGDAVAKTSDDVIENWNKIKQIEKLEKKKTLNK